MFKISVLLSPTAVFADFMLQALESDSKHRNFLCAILINARSVTTVIIASSAFFSFLFRSLVVLHAEKGLIVKGRPDLKLLNQLFWLIMGSYTVFVLFIVFNYYRTIILTKTYVSSNIMAICLVVDGKEDGDLEAPFRAIGPAFRLVQFCVMVWIYSMVNGFLKGLCPDQKMSCIGKYRRNILSLKETFWLSQIIMTSGILEDILQALFTYLEVYFSKESIFVIWNITNFISKEGLFLFIPIIISKPNKEIKSNKETSFYVRPQTVFVPRKACTCTGKLCRLCHFEVATFTIPGGKKSTSFSYLAHKYFGGGPIFKNNRLPAMPSVQ
jgi:hypothetical protein